MQFLAADISTAARSGSYCLAASQRKSLLVRYDHRCNLEERFPSACGRMERLWRHPSRTPAQIAGQAIPPIRVYSGNLLWLAAKRYRVKITAERNHNWPSSSGVHERVVNRVFAVGFPAIRLFAQSPANTTNATTASYGGESGHHYRAHALRRCLLATPVNAWPVG